MLTGLLSIAAAAPVWAQDAQVVDETPAPADTEAVRQSQTMDSTEIEEVVVTGSRIRRNEFTSASPIQIITKDVSTQAGLVSTASIIQGSTVASGSSQTNSLFSSFVTDGGPGVQTVSLRGLGSNRTLVLLNGRRLAPAGAGGTVGAGADLNVIPSGVLQRIEILKDGASSVYGSDAVAGVVNAITTTNFDGLDVGAFQTVTQDGGGEQTSFDITWGKAFNRGNVLIGLEYQEQRKLLYSDRDWADCGYDNLNNPDLDSVNADGSRKCVSGTWHGFLQTPFGYLAPSPGDVAFGVVPNYRELTVEDYATGGVDETSYDGPFDDERSLIFPTKRFTATAFVNYDLNALGGAEAYGEFLYNNRQSKQVNAGQFFPTIGYDDPRNPGSIIVDAYGFPTAFASVTPVAPLRYEDEQDVDYVRAVGGIRGDLSSGFLTGWNWDLSYMFSGSYADYSGERLLADRVANALDVVSDGAGGVVCADPAAVADGCVPLPVFESRFLMDGVLTEAERAYVYSRESGSTEFTSHQINGSITGDLFELPAGPLAVALGFEMRRDSIDDQPSVNSQIGNVYGYTSASATVGTEKVYEVFGEIEAPLLAQLPYMEALTLSASARYTKYEETGYKDGTYKLGLNWTVDPTLRLRATYGTSFRAPALYELFLAGQSGFYNGSDPCANYQDRDPTTNLYQNCVAELGVPDPANPDFDGFNSTPQITTYGARNRPSTGLLAGDLEAETSDALTIGLIWTPSFVPFSIAIDYFDIKVDGEISALDAGSILSSCYGEEPDDFRTAGTLCDLISIRTPYDPAAGTGGDIEEIETSYFNINSQRTAGFDITTRYTHEFAFGDFSLDTKTTVTTIDQVQVFGDSEVNDFNGTFSDPKVVSEIDFRLERGDWTFFWRANFIGEQSNYQFYAPPNNSPRTSNYDIRISEQWLHTASVTYEGEEWEATVGINNLFDEEPDSISSAFTRLGRAGFNSQLDPFGRTMFVSLRKSF